MRVKIHRRTPLRRRGALDSCATMEVHAGAGPPSGHLKGTLLVPCQTRLIMHWVVTDPDVEALSSLLFTIAGSAAYPPPLLTLIRRSGWRLSASLSTPATPFSSVLLRTEARSLSRSSLEKSVYAATARLRMRLQHVLEPYGSSVRLESLVLLPHSHAPVSPVRAILLQV